MCASHLVTPVTEPQANTISWKTVESAQFLLRSFGFKTMDWEDFAKHGHGAAIAEC